MQKYILLYLALFLLSSCNSSSTQKENKNQITSLSTTGNKTAIVSSNCDYNVPVTYTYYRTPNEAHTNFLKDTSTFLSYPGEKKLKPFWDIRYVNKVNQYTPSTTTVNHATLTGLDARNGINAIQIGTKFSKFNESGSIGQSKCIDGQLASGAIINLNDAPKQSIVYAGPQSTFAYRLGRTARTSPWKSTGKGNLNIEAYLNTPIYNNLQNNIGGGVYFAFFIHNKKTNALLNYVIGLYAMGEAWTEEKDKLKYDPTTNIVHIATVIKDDSQWCTKSSASHSIQNIKHTPNKKISHIEKWNNLFRVNITYNNLLSVLVALNENPPNGAENIHFGLSPQDWEVTSIMLQYELEETGGSAILSGSFRGFEAYSSEDPL